MDESDWERVLELARGYDDGCTPREYADQQRRRGEPEGICRMLETHLALGDVPMDPDERWAAQQVGARIDIRAHLQDGGAASVYLGVLDPKGRAQPVAVKMFRLQQSAGARAAAREAWLRERDLLEEFSQKGRVAPLVEAGEHRAEDGTEYLYLCTEYKHGANLAQWCRQHALGASARLQLFAQVCDAVAQIHSHGLVHGDLKPANIQVEAQDSGARAWILDLGLIAVRGRVWRKLGEGLVGTPGYMSPEQIASDGVVGDATDVYALGAILFELLEERPFLTLPARLDADSLLQALTKRPAPELRGGIPEAARVALQSAVRRATALDPRERYPQVCVLSEVVRGVLPALLATELEAVPALPALGATQAPAAGRDRAIWITALLLVFAFAAFLVFAFAPSSRLDGMVRDLVRSDEFASSCDASDRLPGESETDCFARRLADRFDGDRQRVRELLPSVLLRVGADPDASGLERARAAYLRGDYVDAQRLALAAAAAAGEGAESARAQEVAAWAALQRQEYPDALRYLDQAELRQAEWDRDHGLDAVAGARLRYTRAFALYRSADARAAVELLRPTLAELAARLGTDHPASQRARGLLAAALLAAGQPAQAAAELRELIALRERLLGPQHRDTLQSRHNLAIALAQLGERDAAEREYRSLLPAFAAVFGPEYRATLQLRLNLAALLQGAGRASEAEREYGELCELFEHLLGADHSDTLSCREYRAMALAALERSAEAESLQHAVLEARERTLGPAHADTLRSRQNLALLLSRQPDRLAEAEAHCRSALRGASSSTALGRDHPLTLASQRLLAQILSERGDYAQAESEYRKLLTSYENGPAGASRDQLQPALRRDIAGVYVGLSWAQLLEQRPGDALKAAEDGLLWDPSDLPLAANRAHALLLLGRSDEALRLYAAHTGEPLRPEEPRRWETAVLEDLAALERAGVTHSGFAKVRSLLGSAPGHSA